MFLFILQKQNRKTEKHIRQDGKRKQKKGLLILTKQNAWLLVKKTANLTIWVV